MLEDKDVCVRRLGGGDEFFKSMAARRSDLAGAKLSTGSLAIFRRRNYRFTPKVSTSFPVTAVALAPVLDFIPAAKPEM